MSSYRRRRDPSIVRLKETQNWLAKQCPLVRLTRDIGDVPADFEMEKIGPVAQKLQNLMVWTVSLIQQLKPWKREIRFCGQLPLSACHTVWRLLRRQIHRRWRLIFQCAFLLKQAAISS
jgi:hypothetical protein